MPFRLCEAQSTVVPSLNVTVPVGRPPLLPLTVAVNVMTCPTTAGLLEDPSVVVVEAWFTVWMSAGDVLPAYVASPPYTAVMEWLPAVSKEVAKLAWPEPLSDAEPSVVLPSLKVTVPVGVLPLPNTVAVKVTGWPNADGFRDDIRAVFDGVEAWLTTWVSTAELLPLKLLSPPYTAVMEWLPTVSPEVVRPACPEPFRATIPKSMLPSKKVTVPVGVPPLPVTVAVKVTACPAKEGFSEEITVVVVVATPKEY